VSQDAAAGTTGPAALLSRGRQHLFADTPVGRNREHAILYADRCVAVNPSDTAPP